MITSIDSEKTITESKSTDSELLYLFHKTSDEAHNFYKRKSRALDMEPLNKMENEWPKSKSPLISKHNKSSQNDLHRLPAFSQIFFFQTVNKDTKDSSNEKKNL